MKKEKLIELFLFEKPYVLKFEYRKQDFNNYKKALNDLLADRLIALVEKNSKTILYKYLEK